MTTSREATTTFVERYIGKRAFGVVSELIGHEPPAVIKKIVCKNDKDREMFKNECEALTTIDHENVVRKLYTKKNGEELGIVMEYCQKGPLKEVILDPTITYSMNTVLTWAIQLFKAIDHMYQRHNMVHRDIKPDKTIFTNYEMPEGFDRDQLLFDIALKRVSEIESPECQSEIQEIVLRCTNFQRILRPPASEVLDLLLAEKREVFSVREQREKSCRKADEFISSLPLMPTEDENQKELMKPIGFDDRTEWVMVECEKRKYEKRFKEAEGSRVRDVMRARLGTLNSAEREKFFKEAPNIVSKLKEETQTFKDARYVIEQIWRIEKEKENLYQKDIYEIFELFVLGDFRKQREKEDWAFPRLRKHHEEIWISSFLNRWRCEGRIGNLKAIKREKYTTNFYYRCFISQLTGEGWIHMEKNEFVSEDLKLWKEIPGRWVHNPRTEIRGYEIENEGKKHELLRFSHYEQIPLERIIEALKKQQKRMEILIKFNLKFLTPIEDSEKNNVPFNIVSLLDEPSEYKSSYWRNYEPYPFPHYLFQLRNPPRPICQNNHSGNVKWMGLGKIVHRF